MGTPIAGRDSAQLQEMVGCIMQMAAIRGDIKGNPSFSTLLERQCLVMMEALQHSGVSLNQIIQRLQVPIVTNYHPIYQVSKLICEMVLWIAIEDSPDGDTTYFP